MILNKTKTGETHSNLKLDKDSEFKSCQESKYLEVIFDTSWTDDKEIRSRIIQARKCIACLNGILWIKTQERRENWTFIMHWLKAFYCMVPKHGDSRKIIRDGSKRHRWMPWGDPREYQEKKELEM
jgi:hypothetical protein